MPHQPKESLRMTWNNLRTRDPLMPPFLRCHFNLELLQKQTCTLGSDGETETALLCPR